MDIIRSIKVLKLWWERTMEKTSTKKTKILFLRRLTIIFAVFLFVGNGLRGQALVELPNPNWPIPKESYKSWSLFLISNPEWVLPESNDKLKQLYDRFQAFGRAIGPDHLAVWFGSQSISDDFYKDVDVLRSAAFCAKLKLPLSKSPYVIVTTDYPGSGLLSSYPETFEDIENYSVLQLNEADASEITEILTELGDQLIVGSLLETNPNSEDFWRIWQQSFEDLRDNLVGFSKKIRLKIKTSFFEIEISSNDEN